jgi:hypothetical protein
LAYGGYFFVGFDFPMDSTSKYRSQFTAHIVNRPDILAGVLAGSYWYIFSFATGVLASQFSEFIFDPLENI